MPAKNYLPFLLVFCINWFAYGQESIWKSIFPVHPDCMDSTGNIIQQKSCTEVSLQRFFFQYIDWSKIKNPYQENATFYLHISKSGDLDGYGIRDCGDPYLAQRFLETIENLPQSDWLPCVEYAEPRGTKVMFSLYWNHRHLDSVRMRGLDFKPITSRRQAKIELIGDAHEFPDGHYAFTRYINFAVELSQDTALFRKINGQKLSVRLRAETIGRVVKIDILSPLHPAVDSLVIAALRKGPLWWPGYSNGGHQTRIALCTLVFRPYVENTWEEIIDLPIEPSFPNGQAALYKFLALHLGPLVKSIPPEEVQEGMLPLQLFINPDGSVYHARLLKKTHPLIEAGVFAMVKKMPKWWVSRDRVRPKKSIVLIPLRIKLE